jgi:hypothetical protein
MMAKKIYTAWGLRQGQFGGYLLNGEFVETLEKKENIYRLGKWQILHAYLCHMSLIPA